MDDYEFVYLYIENGIVLHVGYKNAKVGPKRVQKLNDFRGFVTEVSSRDSSKNISRHLNLLDLKFVIFGFVKFDDYQISAKTFRGT